LIPRGLAKTPATPSASFPDASRMIWSTSKNSSKTAVKKPAPGAARLGKATNRYLNKRRGVNVQRVSAC
jgi:hypothetical protein